MATHIYVKFEPKDGTSVTGDATDSAHKGWFDVTDFSTSVSAPADAGTGRPSGKRHHAPITMSLRVDKAHPLLVAHCIGSRPFSKVTLHMFRVTQKSGSGTKTSSAGEEEKYFTVTVLDAYITNITMDPIPDQSFDECNVTIQYRQIEWRHVEAKTMARDNLDETVKSNMTFSKNLSAS